jgi:hypothetical protein
MRRTENGIILPEGILYTDKGKQQPSGNRPRRRTMKALMLLTGGGSMVILTSFASPTASGLIEKLAGKGITKFIAYELPIELAQKRYGNHFAVVQQDLRESDDLRVLDYNGGRAFHLFRFDEMGPATLYEAAADGRPAALLSNAG